MNFMGYKRPDGSVGIRNHVLILPGCACASETCRVVASQVSGAVNIINNSGCAEVKGNEDMTQKILVGFAANPNVYGVVVIGLGCENVSHSQLRESILKVTNKPVVSFGIQEEGGTLKTIEKAVRVARQMVADASRVTREPCDISNLMLGIECGGSDATSGFGANPAVGNLSDRLVDLGASVRSTSWRAGAPPRKSTTRSSRSAGITKPIWQPPGKTAATASPRPATRRVASPRLRRNPWAVSTRAEPVPSWRWSWRASGPQRRVPSSWTPQDMTSPPSRPWWPAAARWLSLPPGAARPPATR